MSIKLHGFRRNIYALVALIMTIASGLSALAPQFASAGQVQSRFIQLSNATPGATGVTYNVSFKPTSTATIGGIVVDFCADSPIIGSTSCTYPAGFTMGATPTVSGLTGFSTSTGSWVTTNSLQGGAGAGQTQTLFYTNATAQTPTGTTTPINFQITGVTNPTTTGSFYARILTFDTDAHATAQYTETTTTRAATFANERDYGGVAESTSTNVTISAAVMETITFCVSAAAPGNGCTAITTPALTLGHGSPLALDSSAVDPATAYTQLSTNANSGVIVALKTTSSTTCSGLSRDGGATCGIPAQGSFGAMTAGTAAFGLNVANGSGGTGTVTANANYGPTVGSYGMGTAAPFSTYGDPIESSSGACANVNSQLTYAATAATTTPAGIYSTAQSLIATGTF